MTRSKGVRIVSDKRSESNSDGRPPYRVRLPGFVSTEDVGLGDIVNRVTSRVGIRPCRGCQRRQGALNRRVVVTRWKPS
jgi:hypothetical protein